MVTADGAHEGGSDIYADLRVDDHLDPVVELSRLLDMHEVCLDKAHVAGTTPWTTDLLAQVAAMTDRLGFRPVDGGTAAVLDALARWATDNYLSGRLRQDGVDNEAPG